MKKTSRIMTWILIIAMLVVAMPITASAASYPSIFVDYDTTPETVKYGEKFYLDFIIFPEYKNEEYHVYIYNSNGGLEATAEKTYYNTSIATRDISIGVDTANLGLTPGEYKVVYWLSFYTYYSWHDTPTKKSYYFTVTPSTCSGGHTYDNACDTVCNVCNATRSVTHTYTDHTDASCNICGYTRVVAGEGEPPIIDSGKCGANLTWSFNEEGTLTISGFGDMFDYSSDNLPPWGTYWKRIKHIEIEEGVTSIGEFAFSVLDVETVSIASTVTEIGVCGFAGCEKLRSVELPAGLEKLGMMAFSKCKSLKTVAIPSVIENMEPSCFDQCTGLEYVILPDGMAAIPFGTFRGCSGLEYIQVPSSVTAVNQEAFKGCVSLGDIYFTGTESQFDAIVYVEVEETNTYFKRATVHYESKAPGSYPQSGKEGYLTFQLNDTGDSYMVSSCDPAATGDLVIPATYNGLPVTYIAMDAFWNCTGLTSVTIPNSVDTIGPGAFASCTGLTSIVIPNSVTTLGGGAFADCSNLANLTISDSVTFIGGEAFGGCNIKKLTIADGSKTIAAGLIQALPGLEDIVIPSSVTSIEYDAFYDYTGLKGVYITDIAAWCKMNFGTWSANPLSVAGNLYLNGELVTDLVIPEGVDAIEFSAFYNCTSLTSVTIPSSVTRIANLVFAGCTGLTKVVLPTSVAIIGDYAFSGCNSLNTVFYCGTQEQLREAASPLGNEPLFNATLQHKYENGVCSLCGENEPCQHNWSTATCTVPATCSICGEVNGEALGHSWVAATYDSPMTCSTCGATEGDVLTCQHNMQQTAAAIAPTCETPGKTAVLTCANGCGHTEGGVEIPALGHNMQESAAATEPTCTAAGKTATMACANGCGKTEGGEEIPAKGHNLVDGVCSVCGQGAAVLGDANGDGKINLRDAILVLQASNGKDVAVDRNAADVTGDGKMNIRDAILILKRANGNKEPFPAEK